MHNVKLFSNITYLSHYKMKYRKQMCMLSINKVYSNIKNIGLMHRVDWKVFLSIFEKCCRHQIWLFCQYVVEDGQCKAGTGQTVVSGSDGSAARGTVGFVGHVSTVVVSITDVGCCDTPAAASTLKLIVTTHRTHCTDKHTRPAELI